MLDLYFGQSGRDIQQKQDWAKVAGDNTPGKIVQWIDDLIQVGWQLCSNT
jgi:CRISPR-associated protein Cmr2